MKMEDYDKVNRDYDDSDEYGGCFATLVSVLCAAIICCLIYMI